MKFSFFTGLVSRPRPGRVNWPVSPARFDQTAAEQALERFLHLFDLADRLGFDWLATPEHHALPFLVGDPLLIAAMLSRRGYRARIALLGLLVGGRDPALLAENVAAVDQLTGGNAVYGLFRGFANEQITFDVAPEDFRERQEEAVALLLRAWEEPEPFAWQGRHFARRSVSSWPRPVQNMSKAVLVTANSPDSARFAARRGLSVGIGHKTVEAAARLAALYREEAARAGWSPTPENILYHADVYVAAPGVDAWAEAERLGLGRLPNSLDGETPGRRRIRRALGETEPDAGRAVDRVMRFCGDPEAVTAQIAQARDQIGFGVLNGVFRAPGPAYEACVSSMTLFAEQVIPRLRESSGEA